MQLQKDEEVLNCKLQQVSEVKWVTAEEWINEISSIKYGAANIIRNRGSVIETKDMENLFYRKPSSKWVTQPGATKLEDYQQYNY